MGDWVWDGGRPSIDLLNTIRDRTLGGRETLRTVTDLAAWLAEADHAGGGPPGGPAPDASVAAHVADPGMTALNSVGPDAADLDAFRRLRAAIGALVLPDEPSRSPAHDDDMLDAIAIINAAANAPIAARLSLDERGRPVAVPPEWPASAALARIAMDAIDLLTGDELVRVCAAHDCGIRFADRSPARNRQWCSMRRCGNRTKARRHYARARN